MFDTRTRGKKTGKETTQCAWITPSMPSNTYGACTLAVWPRSTASYVGTVPVDFGPVRYMPIRLGPPPRRRDGLDPLSPLSHAMIVGTRQLLPRVPRLAL